jgi:hypothetical protein
MVGNDPAMRSVGIIRTDIMRFPEPQSDDSRNSGKIVYGPYEQHERQKQHKREFEEKVAVVPSLTFEAVQKAVECVVNQITRRER